MTRYFEHIGRPFVIMIEAFGRIVLLLFEVIAWMMRPLSLLRFFLNQRKFVGADIDFSDDVIKALPTSVPLPI